MENNKHRKFEGKSFTSEQLIENEKQKNADHDYAGITTDIRVKRANKVQIFRSNFLDELNTLVEELTEFNINSWSFYLKNDDKFNYFPSSSKLIRLKTKKTYPCHPNGIIKLIKKWQKL